jgi:dipeptidyl aminopeptidase/acylaminoacyl peptidase
LLIVHGANDDVVPITDARELADAADASSELRILAGAGHALVHDPRAIALLLGWFDRHLGSAAEIPEPAPPSPSSPSSEPGQPS